MGESRPCPACHTGSEKAKLFIEKNLDPVRLSGFSFASRKEPEYMCHRLVQCPNCDLVYADSGEDELAHAYHVADYDSSEDANDAAKAFVNIYALRYWMHLASLPSGIKSGLSSLMATLGVDDVKLGVNVGNFITTGIKHV